MTELADNFEQNAIQRFSDGPEKDITIDVEHATQEALGRLPEKLIEYLDTLDPFTRRSLLTSLEGIIETALEDGVEIGEDAEQYRREYEEYGWQFDPAKYTLSPAAHDKVRNAKLAQIAQGLSALQTIKATENSV